MHIANGNVGLILVEHPKEDCHWCIRIIIIMQRFYTKGANGRKRFAPFEHGKKLLIERADYVVFNGKMGALTGDQAITATLRNRTSVVGNGGPNLVSSLSCYWWNTSTRSHVEGGEFDNENVQNTYPPAGGAAIM